MQAEYPMELLLHATSVILAVAATVWAIYLVHLAGRVAAPMRVTISRYATMTTG